MAFGFMAIHRQEWLVDEMIALAKGVKKNNNSKIEQDILLYKQSLLNWQRIFRNMYLSK